jgi:hypothetical protein
MSVTKVGGQDRGDVVHDVFGLGGHVIAADDLAATVDGDLAGHLQDGLTADFRACDVGVAAERGGDGRRVIEHDHDGSLR